MPNQEILSEQPTAPSQRSRPGWIKSLGAVTLVALSGLSGLYAADRQASLLSDARLDCNVKLRHCQDYPQTLQYRDLSTCRSDLDRCQKSKKEEQYKDCRLDLIWCGHELQPKTGVSPDFWEPGDTASTCVPVLAQCQGATASADTFRRYPGIGSKPGK